MRLGADPEVFLQDAAGKHISVIGMIQADKWNPYQIPDMPAGFTLQEDNVALEYGIPPAATEDEWVHHIQAVMAKSKDWTQGLSFSKLSCTIFPEDQMQHPLAFVFGCEPDFNGWTGKVNPKPNPPHKFMRSAGGHVHIETTQPMEIIIPKCDLFLGVPSTLMDEGEDRKKLYGKHGACRPKPYGVEYRVLSNYWIFTEELNRWIWRNTAAALAFDGDNSTDFHEDRDAIVEAIDNNNKEAAKYLVEKYDLEVL